MTRQEIAEKLKQALIAELNLEEVSPADIQDNTLLFGEGLALDSIDAVEIVVMLEKHFGVVIKSTDEAKLAFVNFGVLVDFITQKQKTA